MDRLLRAAVIGHGKMGKIRSESVQLSSAFELVAVCDTNPSENETGMPLVDSYRDLLPLGLDAVFVCTPTMYAPEIVCFFLDHKVHVFCEKPPGKSIEDVNCMLEAEQANPGLKLKFGFNHRYHQAILDAKSVVDGGRLGDILWMRGIYGKGGGSQYDQSWRNNREISGGGILIDQGIHMVDLFMLFAGEFNEVKSFITKSYWNVGVEDNAFALMRNQKGQVAMLHSSATQWKYDFVLDIYLARGYVSVSGILSSTMNYGTESLRIARCVYDGEGYPLPNPDETITYYDEDQSWMMELQEFSHAIRKGEAILVGSCTDAYKVMSLIESIYSSDLAWEWPTVSRS